MTSTLVDVRRMLGNRVGRDILLLSITLQPGSDTPERLREYASRYGAGPGIVFLTGKPGDIDLLRHALGFTDERNPEQDGDPSRHLGILRVGNESRDWWAACSSLSGASQICALLNSMDAPAVGTKPPLEDPEGPPRTVSLSLPDLRDFEALRADLDRMHLTRAALEWSAYEGKMLSRMAQYLKLGDREGSWRAAMKRALDGSLGARRRMEAVRAEHGNVREAWSRYQEEQSRAIAALDSVLDSSPRHRAFRDYGASWLFYLEGHPDHAER